MNGARVVGVGPVHGPGQYEHDGPTTGIAAMFKKILTSKPPYFLYFNPFSQKNFTYRLFSELFMKMNPGVGAVVHGAELTRLGATDHGAEMPCTHKHLANLASTWP